jgi:hypothetical protein
MSESTAAERLDLALNKNASVSDGIKRAIEFCHEIADYIDGTPIVSWNSKDGLSISIPVELDFNQTSLADEFSTDPKLPASPVQSVA